MNLVINLMVTTDMSQKEIANEIGIEESTISRWKKKEEFQVEKERQEKEFLRDLKSPAIKTLRRLLNAKSEFVQYSTAVYIVDKTDLLSIKKEELSVMKLEKELANDKTTEDKIADLMMKMDEQLDG